MLFILFRGACCGLVYIISNRSIMFSLFAIVVFLFGSSILCEITNDN